MTMAKKRIESFGEREKKIQMKEMSLFRLQIQLRFSFFIFILFLSICKHLRDNAPPIEWNGLYLSTVSKECKTKTQCENRVKWKTIARARDAENGQMKKQKKNEKHKNKIK